MQIPLTFCLAAILTGGKMLNILYEDNHLLVLIKEPNVPMMEDASQDLDLLSMAKAYLKEKYQKPGNVYLGLVHRLDRPVGGVCVLAKTSKAAARLSRQMQNNEWQKEYLAVIEAHNIPAKGELRDYLLKDSKTNMVKVAPEGKLAILDYEVIKENKDLSLVRVLLKTGRSHQIRVQFASRHWPLYGDQRYNPQAKKGQQIALWAYRLSFIHPTLKKRLSFTAPINRYPFNI